MRITVAGGAGYIGSHTCKALAQAGIYNRFRQLADRGAKWGPLEHGDINDSAVLANVMRKHRPEAVINFAACTVGSPFDAIG